MFTVKCEVSTAIAGNEYIMYLNVTEGWVDKDEATKFMIESHAQALADHCNEVTQVNSHSYVEYEK